MRPVAAPKRVARRVGGPWRAARRRRAAAPVRVVMAQAHWLGVGVWLPWLGLAKTKKAPRPAQRVRAAVQVRVVMGSWRRRAR